jgi:2-oxoglutarate ferredoxin oxidoreductase subunit alpha
MLDPPRLVGQEGAAVTLVGFGSTEGVVLEAIELLAGEEGVAANQLNIRWIVPFHVDAVKEILSASARVIIIENNFSGQFARFLRSETGIEADGFIRKYDGEPFMPHHIVEAVKAQLAGETTLSVPVHEYHV